MATAEEKRWFAAVASIEVCVLCDAWGVQVAHSNQDRGMGQKSPACCTAALCPSCHDAIDNGSKLERDERRRLMDRAIVLTHLELVRRGLLVLKR